MVGARRVDPALGGDPRRVCDRDGLAPPPPCIGRTGCLGDARGLRRRCVLLRADARARGPLPARVGRSAGERARAECPVAGQPARALPPALALPRAGRLHHSVRLFGGRAGHPAARRRLAGGDPAVDAPRVDVPQRWHRPRRLVVLSGARLGGILGVGPRRERVAAAVAGRHRVPPLGHGRATPRPFADLEPLARGRHLLAHHSRHVPHPLRRPAVRALLLDLDDRASPPRVLRVGGGRRHRPDRLAWRRIAFPGRDRLAGQPRGGIPRQQPPLRALRGRRAARHRLPAALRGPRVGPAGHRRRAVLQPAGRPDWPRPAVPDGGRPGPALAEELARRGARPARRARRVRGRGGRGLCGRRSARRRTAARVRTGRIRRGVSAAARWRCRSAARGTGREPPARRRRRALLAGWRGLVGRANGGMVVHVGVVVIAVALAAATAYGHRGEVRLARGQSATFAGHTVEFVGTRTSTSSSHSALEAVLRVDRGGIFLPAVTQFGAGTQPVGTPAIDSSLRDDVYLTIDSIPDKGGLWTFGVVVQPLVRWLWLGGALVIVGAVLSAVPGRRRRPTDPVSSPAPDVTDRRPEPARAAPEPVPAGVAAPPVGAEEPGVPIGAGEHP